MSTRRMGEAGEQRPLPPDDPAVYTGRKHKASHCQRQLEAAANERVSQVKAGKRLVKSSPERLRMHGARGLGRQCMTKSNASGPLPPPSSPHGRKRRDTIVVGYTGTARNHVPCRSCGCGCDDARPVGAFQTGHFRRHLPSNPAPLPSARTPLQVRLDVAGTGPHLSS